MNGQGGGIEGYLLYVCVCLCVFCVLMLTLSVKSLAASRPKFTEVSLFQAAIAPSNIPVQSLSSLRTTSSVLICGELLRTIVTNGNTYVILNVSIPSQS